MQCVSEMKESALHEPMFFKYSNLMSPMLINSSQIKSILKKRFIFSCYILTFGTLTCLSSQALSKGRELILWHSMTSEVAEKFVEIVNRFNQKPEIQTQNIKIVACYKNHESLQAPNLAEELKKRQTKSQKNGPHIIQLLEKDRMLFYGFPPLFVPLEKLTKNPSPHLKAENYISQLQPYFQDESNHKVLDFLPFSVSTAILIYNKNAFQLVGLNPESPPRTWETFESLAKRLKTQHLKSVLASSWISGHHFDQLSALHNETLAVKQTFKQDENKTAAIKLTLNNAFFIEHLDKLKTWYQNGWFSLDMGTKAEEDFINGEIAMLTLGVNRLKRIEKSINHRFEIGVGFLPYWKKHHKSLQSTGTLMGISSFWVLAGYDEEDYAVIQQFFEYLISCPIQTEWHQTTGFLPVVKEAELQNSAAKLAFKSIAGQTFQSNRSKEVLQNRLVLYTPGLREMLVQEMKEAIRGHKTSKEALDNVVFMGNKILEGKH